MSNFSKYKEKLFEFSGDEEQEKSLSSRTGQIVKQKTKAAHAELKKNPIKSIMSPLSALGGNSWLNRNKGMLNFFDLDPNENETYKKAWNKFLNDTNQTNADELANTGVKYWKEVEKKTPEAFQKLLKKEDQKGNENKEGDKNKEQTPPAQQGGST